MPNRMPDVTAARTGDMGLPLPAVWAIAPHAAAALATMATARPTADAVAALVARKTEAPYTAVDGVAVIPVESVMVKKSGRRAQYFGWTGMRDVQAAIASAVADKKITGIVLEIDSPGGTIDGLVGLADTVHAAKTIKPVVAHVDGMAASAAYWVASQADAVYLDDRLAEVGSIGVRMLMYDYSAMFETEGVKAIPIDTGEHKSAGAPGTEITEAQIAEFQKGVDCAFDEFVTSVARGRGMTDQAVRAVGDGRMFTGVEAIDLGLADGIKGLATVIATMPRTGFGTATAKARARARARQG